MVKQNVAEVASLVCNNQTDKHMCVGSLVPKNVLCVCNNTFVLDLSGPYHSM